MADRLAERLPRPLRRMLARARPDVPPLTRPGRSARFRTASHNRFWWHRLRSTDYVPPLYAGLSRREGAVVQGWFAQTGRHGRTGRPNHQGEAEASARALLMPREAFGSVLAWTDLELAELFTAPFDQVKQRRREYLAAP